MWLAADYSWRLIRVWFQERGWPDLARATIHGYRKRNGIEIETLAKARRGRALSRGLALKEERVRRLCDHADALDAIKWEPDEKGRLWNEKAWREVVSQIADEMEPKKIELSGQVQHEHNGTITIEEARALPADELIRRVRDALGATATTTKRW